MERENIVCIFCGAIANIKEPDDLIIVVCPMIQVSEYYKLEN